MANRDHGKRLAEEDKVNSPLQPPQRHARIDAGPSHAAATASVGPPPGMEAVAGASSESSESAVTRYYREPKETRDLYSEATMRNGLLEAQIAQLQQALEDAERRATCATQQRAESDTRVANLTVRLEALQDAGNDTAAAVNAAGASVVDRVNHVPVRVHEVALHGVRQGATMALAAARAYTGISMSGLELTPKICNAMDVHFDAVEGVAEEIADSTPSVFIIDKVFE